MIAGLVVKRAIHYTTAAQKCVTVNCQIIYSTEKLISVNSVKTILIRRGTLDILKIRDIITSLYPVNLTLTKFDRGSRL